MTPIDASGNDFVIGLEENTTISEIIKEGINGWLNIQRVQPQGENTGFSLAFGIEIFDF